MSIYSGIMCLSGCLFGFDTGSIGSITTMPQFIAHFGELSEFMRGLVVSVILLPSAMTGILAGRVSDKISRKYTISLGCALFAVGTSIACAAPNLAGLLIGRCIAGSGEGFFLSATTVYLCETCPAHMRARVICGFQLAITGALSLGFFLTYGSIKIQSSLSWRLPFLYSIGTGTLVALVAPMLPYSPRWLVMHGRKEEAIAVLNLITNPDDEAERAELLAVPPVDKNGSWFDMFQKGVRGRTALGVSMQIFQMLSGIDFVLFYAPTLFAQAGLSGSSSALIASGVTGLLLVFATLCGTLLVDRLNRRTIIINGGAVVSASMLLIGIMYGTGAAHGRVGKWFVILLIELFAFSFAVSWAVVIRLYTSEIMPAKTRSSASSLGTGANQLINTIVALTSPAFLAKSPAGPYFMYGSLMAFGTVIAWVFMIETKGKSLEGIDSVFEQGAVAVKLPSFPFRGAGNAVEAGTTGFELRNRRGSSSRRRSSAQDADGRELFRGRRGLERLESDAYVPTESAIDE